MWWTQLVLALLAAAMLVGSDWAQEGNDERQAQWRSRILDVQRQKRSLSLDWQLLPPRFLGATPDTLTALAALPALEADTALDNAGLIAELAASGHKGRPRGKAVDAAPALGMGPILAPITFYSCEGPNGGYCGVMSSGKVVYEGAAACGSSYALGERVRIAGDPTERAYVCEDHGWLAPNQVDVFWYSEEDGRAWITQVGRWAEVGRESGSRP